jgi:acetoin utilization deacetylase AcuC-like enzyme
MHVESAERLRVLRAALTLADPGALREADPAPLAAIERVHPRSYVELLEAFAAGGGGAMHEPDMIIGRKSVTAGLAAAGAVLAAVRHACSGAGNSFAAVRPPGHHALRDQPMGFCLFGNAVIGAREAQTLGRDRVLIVDWDVHHGNGTQALVEQDPSIRFISMHQWPHYPGTGPASESGVGNVINLPRPPGLPPERYVGDLVGAIREAVHGWSPGLVLISAGYDCLRGDPLGGFTLEPEHLAGVVGTIRELCPGAPVVGLLEGGYAPQRVAAGVLATLEALV